MSPEDVKNEIKLIFARACAASLEKRIDHILSSKKEGRAEAVEAVAAMHATTCLKLTAAFNPATIPSITFPADMSFAESSAWASAQADDWRVIAHLSSLSQAQFESYLADQPSLPLEAYRLIHLGRLRPLQATTSSQEPLGEDSPEARLPASDEPR